MPVLSAARTHKSGGRVVREPPDCQFPKLLDAHVFVASTAGDVEIFVRRTTCDVDSALRARSPLAAAFELFGVGWWTIETLFTDRTPGGHGTLTGSTPDADRDVEGP